MAEKLPEGVANLDDYREEKNQANVEATEEELDGHHAEKARASLEMAKIVDDLEFPDNDFEMLLASDREKLNGFREALYEKMEELTFDEAGAVRNDKRHLVEFIGQRLAVLDELLSIRSSEEEAAKLFEMKEAA